MTSQRSKLAKAAESHELVVVPLVIHGGAAAPPLRSKQVNGVTRLGPLGRHGGSQGFGLWSGQKSESQDSLVQVFEMKPSHYSSNADSW